MENRIGYPRRRGERLVINRRDEHLSRRSRRHHGRAALNGSPGDRQIDRERERKRMLPYRAVERYTRECYFGNSISRAPNFDRWDRVGDPFSAAKIRTRRNVFLSSALIRILTDQRIKKKKKKAEISPYVRIIFSARATNPFLLLQIRFKIEIAVRSRDRFSSRQKLCQSGFGYINRSPRNGMDAR